MRAARNDRLFIPLMIALIATAWIALVIWGLSPYGAYLNHDQLEGARLVSPQLGILVAGWTLMIVAMMLPTSLPLVALFRRMTVQRADALRLIVLLITGYLGAWILFGVVVHLLDLGVHRAVDASAALERNEWAIGAGTFLLAGCYQFSALKYRCLEQCRSPLAFIVGRWSGRAPGRQALRLGVEHGLFCLGCCWLLMLVMFAVGMGNLGWMLMLGALMAIEKNLPWGRRLSPALGVGLLGTGIAVAALALVA